MIFKDRLPNCPTVGQFPAIPKEISGYLQNLAEWRGQGNFTLDRVREVAESIGNPQDSFKTVHVAGTNGKGSVVSTVARVIESAGVKVGKHTSPHLASVLERFMIGGVPCSLEELSRAFSTLVDAVERLGSRLSYFEFTTLLAFLIFRDLKVDYGIIEVGLGGRLDATNIISKPEVSVITTIDLDHTEILGNTLVDIAIEKSGIIKQGTPVVTGDIPREALDVIASRARDHNSECFLWGRDYSCIEIKQGLGGFEMRRDSSSFSFTPSLYGAHQLHNAGVSAMVSRLLGFSNEDCIRGLESVNWPARFEQVTCNEISFVLDVAHNPAGARALKIATEYLAENMKGSSTLPMTIVFGVLSTKDWRGMVDVFRGFIHEWILVTPNSPMALNSDTIADYLSCFGISSKNYGGNVARCIDEILIGKEKPEADSRVVLITGSLYLVGEVRELLRSKA